MAVMSPRHLAAIAALIAAGCQASGNVTVTPSPGPSAASPSPDAMSGRMTGESKAVYGANASLYTVSANGAYSEIGFELPLAAIEAAPTTGTGNSITTLRFPEAVRAATFLDHLDIDYNVHGHAPEGVYNVPHFDFHFYGVDEATKRAVDCTDETAPAAERVPQGYAFLPPPKGECVPMMGYHLSDLSSPELSQSSPAPFTRSMILGYYAGKQYFIEPMATRAFLLQKQDFTLNIGRPAALGRQTMYPGTLKATFDTSRNVWVFALQNWMATSR